MSTDANGDGVPDECSPVPDLDAGGSVDVRDLLILLDAWAAPEADLDGDGTTGVSDLLALLSAWGPTTPTPDCSGGRELGDCCDEHDTPSCADADCCEAVCAADAFCCTMQWDAICVNLAQVHCGCPPPSGCGELDAGLCCIPGGGSNGSPGCNDPACCELICDYIDPFCCDVEWDSACGDWAFQACDICPPVVCSPDAKDCCEGQLVVPGCNDVACCELVCTQDFFCCDVAWDATCALHAQNLCDTCVGYTCSPEAGSCCEPNGSPGCEHDLCCQHVCNGFDEFCCEVEWDEACVGHAAAECGLCG